MIYASGHQAPTKLQLAHVREEADDSFCQTPSSERFDYAVPCPEGYTFEPSTITLLSMKNVEPHDDPWVGSVPSYVNKHAELPPGWTHDGPEGRRAMFWVVHLPKFQELFLQCGTQAKRMRAGDWVVFDDRILHCVLSTRKWYGCAYQLIPVDLARALEPEEEL